MYHLLLAPGGRNIFIRALCCLLFWSYKLFKTSLNCMFKAPTQQSFHFQLNCPSLLQYFFSSSELQRITTHIWGLTPLCSKHLSCIILQKNKEVDIVFDRDQFGERKYILQSRPIQMRIYHSNERCCISAILRKRGKLF